MDRRVEECPGLTAEDIAFLQQVEAGLPITADVSRADVLLCCLLGPQQALVVSHALPHSISSLYREAATGQILTPEEEPLLFRALKTGRGGRRSRELFSSGAPVIQDVYPIRNREQRVIAALMVETNMIAHERHRRRHRSFRQAVNWLQAMCCRGELAACAEMSRFGLYDGIYLVDRNRTITYMSGIAANLFRSIGLVTSLQGQLVSELEAEDDQMVEEAFQAQRSQERRHETADGRVWVRKVIPLRMPPSWLQRTRVGQRLARLLGTGERQSVDAVLVLLHNATEAVQKQRELNVKSAIIQEVHHRVKNNLQTIAAILRIQARRCESDEARQHLLDAVNRILSMSVIHEFLSQDEHQPINIRDVCQRVAQQVTQVAGTPDQEVALVVRGPNIRLPASQATPAALVINELMLNAMEHGLGGHAKGRIEIELSDLGDAVRVEIQNSGSALPPDFDPHHSGSLGLQIVHTLVTDDLKGELQIESIPQNGDSTTSSDRDEVLGNGEPEGHFRGTRAVVTFPKRSLKVD